MIIGRYLIKETLKTQIAILFILLLIFFSQKLIRILSSAVDGNLPNDLIIPLLILGISSIADIILPLSLFLGILVTLGRLYSDSEMVAMQACGIKKNVIYRAVVFLCVITCSIATINATWFGPWSNIQDELLRENAKINPSLAGLLAGKFQQSPNGNSVIYIGDVNQNNLNGVFIVQLNSQNGQPPATILAEKGTFGHDKEGNQIITLDEANRYEGTALLKDFRISNFKNYVGILKKKSIDTSSESDKSNVLQLNLFQLNQSHTPNAQAEFYWRLTLIISVPLMAFLVIPLSVSNPRQGRLSQVLPALLIYLVYFLLTSTIKANASRGRISPEFWFYLINLTYFVVALILNFRDSMFMRKLRLKSILA